jgi:hypothetical protein
MGIKIQQYLEQKELTLCDLLSYVSTSIVGI